MSFRLNTRGVTTRGGTLSTRTEVTKEMGENQPPPPALEPPRSQGKGAPRGGGGGTLTVLLPTLRAVRGSGSPGGLTGVPPRLKTAARGCQDSRAATPASPVSGAGCGSRAGQEDAGKETYPEGPLGGQAVQHVSHLRTGLAPVTGGAGPGGGSQRRKGQQTQREPQRRLEPHVPSSSGETVPGPQISSPRGPAMGPASGGKTGGKIQPRVVARAPQGIVRTAPAAAPLR